jgi:integrase
MEKTWTDASQKWLAGRDHRKWVKQERHYVDVLTALDAGGKTLGDTQLTAITRGVVSDMREELMRDRGVSTVNRYLTVFRAVLNVARDEWGWIDTFPKIKRMEEPKRVRYIEKEEAQRLLAELPPHLKDKVIFALSTGLRDANVRELEWDEVDLINRMVTIPPTKHKSGAKTGLPLSIPLNDTAWEVLSKKSIAKNRNEKWVFVYGGKPVHRSGTSAFREALKRAGIDNFRWHDLRHTWASWHIQKGTHTAAVREMGGWSDDRMVQRYAHLSTEHLRGVADNIGTL